MDIMELDLSVRPINCLNRAGIKTVEQLLATSVRHLLGFRNFGKKSLAEIVEKLADRGLRMHDDACYWRMKDYRRRVTGANLEERHAVAIDEDLAAARGYVPILGPFGPEDRWVMEQHFRDLRRGGVDFALIEQRGGGGTYRIGRRNPRQPVGCIQRAWEEVREKLQIPGDEPIIPLIQEMILAGQGRAIGIGPE